MIFRYLLIKEQLLIEHLLIELCLSSPQDLGFLRVFLTKWRKILLLSSFMTINMRFCPFAKLTFVNRRTVDYES